MGFWNVAGVRNKEEGFWKEVKEWEVVVMVETWVDGKSWDRVRRKLPKGYRWEKQLAKRRSKKGRPMGGIIIGVKEEEGIASVIEVEEKEEGVMAVEIWVGEERWRIVGVYVKEDMERKLEVMKEWLEEQEEGRWTMIGGDFNARTGGLGGWAEDREEEEVGRKSKDGKVNGEGRRLVGGLERVGWGILNGAVEGDEEGEFTYTGGRGESVIDYVIGEEKVKNRVVRMEIGDSVESDHHPIIVSLMRKGEGRRKRGRGGEERRGGRWTARGGERIREGVEWDMREDRGIDEELEAKIGRIGEELKEGEKEDGKRKKLGWWDEECEEKRKELRRTLGKWRRRGGGGEGYRRESGI